MTTKKDGKKSVRIEFKQAKTKKKKTSVKQEQPYRGGANICRKPGQRSTPGWIRKEQW